ncbi:pyruvate dehydrogenase E1 component [Methylophilaceae bacterium]|nr:pyruvate dehydrogenase E1 component [Methylophilaceae bacterium]
MSDQDIWRLNRGGHDPHKVFAAYAAATSHKGQPSVVLAKTVKVTAWEMQAKDKILPINKRAWILIIKSFP